MVRLVPHGPDNFDTDLIINTGLPQGLANLSGRSVYTFYYELRLENLLPDAALSEEKGIFLFQVHYYMDPSDYYECTLEPMSYYVGKTL